MCVNYSVDFLKWLSFYFVKRRKEKKMRKIYIVGLDCSVSEAIRYALKGHKILVPESKNGKPSIELINFTEKEAKKIFKEISSEADINAKLIVKK